MKNQPDLLEFIKRVKKIHRIEGRNILPSIENSTNFLTANNYRLSNEVAELREKVEKQERTINGLLDILSRVFKSGVSSMNFENINSKPRPEGIINYNAIEPKYEDKGLKKSKKDILIFIIIRKMKETTVMIHILAILDKISFKSII